MSEKKIRELVILSGKGGCGKTSIAASFATLSKDAVFADCDVDAADLMLVLQPEKIRSEDFYSGELPVIDNDKCINCGKCLELCRFNAIKNNQGNCYTVIEANCEGCGVCADNCGIEAISMQPRLCGDAGLSKTPYGTLAHARLGAGGENSGKLVSHVRKMAKDVALEQGKDLIIVDGPPGIGCPVIASLGGAWRCLIVTEPTMSGLHDLKRVLRLTKHFDVPAYVCVNKYDINPDISAEIKKITADAGSEFLGCVPYDNMVTDAQRHGVAVVSKGGVAAEAIKEIWNKINVN